MRIVLVGRVPGPASDALVGPLGKVNAPFSATKPVPGTGADEGAGRGRPIYLGWHDGDTGFKAW